ncbi:tetratricopeptide repeat protein [Psychroserpens sp.]
MKFYLKLVIYFLLTTFTVNAYQENPSQKFQDSISVEVTKLTDSLKAQKYYNASFHALAKLNDLELSRKYADSSLYYAKVSGFKDSEAKSHFQFGVLERIEGDYKLALQHLDTNIAYFKNDSTLMAYSLFQVAVIHKTQGDYKNSLKTYVTILDIFEKKKDSFAIASTLNSIGNIYGEMKKPNEAINNFDKALLIFENLKAERDIANAHENIGKMYLLKQDTISARLSIQKALKTAVLTNESFQIARASHSLGETYLNSKPEEAFKYLNKAEELLEKVEFKSSLISVYRDLGYYFKKEKYFEKSLEYYEKSLSLAKKLKEKPYQKDAYKGLYEVYSVTGNFNKAFVNQSKYIAIKDSLFTKENIKEINFLQAQFETQKKDKEIAEQQLQLEKKSMQNKLITGIAVFLLISSILSWLVFKQRQKRKNQELLVLKNESQINALESLIEGEEKERLRIAKELHDGVNGDLSAIKHKLNTLLKLNNKTIEEAVVMIDKSCEQVRAISHNLVPPALANFDLKDVASDYCANMNNIHKPNINFTYLGESVNLPKIIEINIFRIIQELVTNSIKHADAKSIDVQLSVQGNTLQLAVEDNGKGFDITKPNKEGVGISNMKHRVSFLNGEIDFTSNDEGTFVNIIMDKSRFNVS